jgi:hypothetical protein
MAISYDNAITKNYHGMMGGIVFRCIGNKSIMSKRPDCSKVVKTEAQKANMKRFAAATIYGKKVLNNPRLREYYRKKKKEHQSIWNAAISDFLKKPKVKAIDLKGYKGQPGNAISISVWDRFKIESVSVTILNDMGQVIESGFAVASPLSENMEWDYIATVMNPSYKGSRVVVRVSDLPGNVVQETMVIDST